MGIGRKPRTVAPEDSVNCMWGNSRLQIDGTDMAEPRTTIIIMFNLRLRSTVGVLIARGIYSKERIKSRNEP